MEDLKTHLEVTKIAMEKIYLHTQKSFNKIRAGKVHPSLFDNVKILYYNNLTPIAQVASITIPDAKTIFIKPWEKNMIKIIEKSIIDQNFGFTPQNDGETIRINLPSLTEERRKELIKQVKNETEKNKISIRNERKNAKEMMKKYKKEGVSEDEIKKAEEQLQKNTDAMMHNIDQLLAKKEKEILTV